MRLTWKRFSADEWEAEGSRGRVYTLTRTQGEPLGLRWRADCLEADGKNPHIATHGGGPLTTILQRAKESAQKWEDG